MKKKNIYKKISQVIRFTNIQWKAFFTGEELEENIKDYYYCYIALKNNTLSNYENSLNTLLNLLIDEIYQHESYSSEQIFTSVEDVEKVIDEYIYMVIEGHLDYNKIA